MDATSSIPSYDVVVIGAGPAGICGARVAALFGKRVAIVEKEPALGGAGINTGTLPSKTLRETALALSGWRSRRLYGVDLSLRRTATMADFVRHRDHVEAAERKHAEDELNALGVERYRGHARFVDPHVVRIANDGAERRIRGDVILIAVGSSPFRPPEFPFEDERVLDSDELMAMTTLPQRLVIVGAGVIGAEYASTFAAIGVEVQLVDGRERLLQSLDAEVSRALEQAMNANGVHFRWREKVTHCDVSRPGPVACVLTSGATLEADAVLVCAGRAPNTAALELAAAGLRAGPRGVLPVDDRYRTSVAHIYAAGDVVGPPSLASSGTEEARIAMCDACGETNKARLAALMPTGIYTIPEAASVGETEEAARARGDDVVVGRARYADLARGRIVGDASGFLKLVFSRSDLRLRGAHLLGEHATDLIHIGLVTMLLDGKAEVFDRACFDHPTLGELYKRATYDALVQLRFPNRLGSA